MILFNVTLVGKDGYTFHDEVWLRMAIGDEACLPELMLPKLDEIQGDMVDKDDNTISETDESDSDTDQRE